MPIVRAKNQVRQPAKSLKQKVALSMPEITLQLQAIIDKLDANEIQYVLLCMDSRQTRVRTDNVGFALHKIRRLAQENSYQGKVVKDLFIELADKRRIRETSGTSLDA